MLYVVFAQILHRTVAQAPTTIHAAAVTLASYSLFFSIATLTLGEFMLDGTVTPFTSSLFAFAVFVVLPHAQATLFYGLNTVLLFALLERFAHDIPGLLNQEINLAVFALLAWFVSRVIYRHHVQEFNDKKRIENLHSSLNEARDDVKVLSGFLPICSYCKKIRNDQGYWDQLGAFIQQHSEARFCHGICPACREVHFPDGFQEMGPGDERGSSPPKP